MRRLIPAIPYLVAAMAIGLLLGTTLAYTHATMKQIYIWGYGVAGVAGGIGGFIYYRRYRS